jgi:superfamily II DNA or RNA helicase
MVDTCSIQKACKKSYLQHLLGYDLLIIDECHRSYSASYLNLIKEINPKHLLGVTATPFRTDKKKIEDVFGKAIYSLPILKLIEEGYLCDFEGYRVKTNISLSSIRKQRGDFTIEQLAPVINVANRNELIVREYKKLAPGEKAICFCADVKHSISLKQEFIKQGISCSEIHGRMNAENRKTILRKFKNGEIDVVTNCQILTEGFDEPSVTCLIMARPTCSKVLYIQMIGRGSRMYSGKKICKVIEFTDNDFDVCFLEDLLEKKIPNFRAKNGESLRDCQKRMEKHLLDNGEDTIVEKTIIIPKSIYERPASPWQIKQLNDKNIPYSHPITEFMANFLLSKEATWHQSKNA